MHCRQLEGEQGRERGWGTVQGGRTDSLDACMFKPTLIPGEHGCSPIYKGTDSPGARMREMWGLRRWQGSGGRDRLGGEKGAAFHPLQVK